MCPDKATCLLLGKMGEPSQHPSVGIRDVYSKRQAQRHRLRSKTVGTAPRSQEPVAAEAGRAGKPAGSQLSSSCVKGRDGHLTCLPCLGIRPTGITHCSSTKATCKKFLSIPMHLRMCLIKRQMGMFILPCFQDWFLVVPKPVLLGRRLSKSIGAL